MSLCLSFLFPFANLFFCLVFWGSPPFSLDVPDQPNFHIAHSCTCKESLLGNLILRPVSHWGSWETALQQQKPLSRVQQRSHRFLSRTGVGIPRSRQNRFRIRGKNKNIFPVSSNHQSLLGNHYPACNWSVPWHWDKRLLSQLVCRQSKLLHLDPLQRQERPAVARKISTSPPCLA